MEGMEGMDNEEEIVLRRRRDRRKKRAKSGGKQTKKTRIIQMSDTQKCESFKIYVLCAYVNK